MKKLFLVLVVCSLGINLFSESLINKDDSFYKIKASTELGAISVLKHTLQNGADSTIFDYREQGGQDILFPYTRYELGIDISKHMINLLYQPLEVVTNVTFREDVKIDTTTFVSGTPMEIKYSFPFWRFTYLYNFSNSEDLIIAGGAALQLRNASLVFKGLGGDDSTTNSLTVSQNLGPVPALSLLVDKKFDNGISLTFDATGLYASSSFINGASFDFTGSLLDTSLKLGFELKSDSLWYLAVRFIGGSATGNSEYVNRTWSESLSSYTDNQLATLVISTGVKLY